MKILCTICARSGSKGIKNKNLLKLNNKTLIQIAVELSKQSKLFSKIIFSSDSNDYCKKALSYGVDHYFKRSKILSNDFSGKIDVIRDVLKLSESYFDTHFDFICDVDVTTPLKNINDLKNSLNKFLKNKYNILFTVCEAKKNPYFNMIEFHTRSNSYKLIKNSFFKRRQDMPIVYSINAGFYFWKRSTLLQNNTVFSRNNGIYEMPYERSIDIDTLDDYKLIKIINDNKK